MSFYFWKTGGVGIHSIVPQIEEEKNPIGNQKWLDVELTIKGKCSVKCLAYRP